MTPIADMVEKMLAEGVPGHVILLAVKTAETTASDAMVRRQSADSPVDKTAEKRRAYDRERMARKRQSTGQSADSPPTSQSASYLKKEKKEAERENVGGSPERRRVGKSLPDDWIPSESHYAEGTQLHRARGEVDALAGEMRLWAKANGHRAVARKLDWDATFLGWMRREWAKPNGSKPPRNPIQGII